MSSIFTHEKLSDYHSTFDPINQYKKQLINYLQVTEKLNRKDAKTLLKKIMDKHPTKDPQLNFHYRKDNFDKVKKTTTLANYIADVKINKEHMAPSFTSYLNPNKVVSKHSDFVVSNLKNRSVTKKAAFQAKEDGNEEDYKRLYTLQSCFKTANNSLSGTYVVKGTMLNNPSAHYTLTSMTRAIASTGNSLSESMIAGNRIYRTPDSVYSHFISIIDNYDHETIDKVIHYYNLYTPTVKDIMDMVYENSRRFWTSEEELKDIEYFVSKLPDVERILIMYNNDFFHLREFNDKLIKGFYTNLVVIKTGLSKDIVQDIKNATDWEINLATHIFMHKIKGSKIRPEVLKGTVLGDEIASTLLNIRKVFNLFGDLIKTFFLTDVMPVDTAYMRETSRKAVVMSDTDSSVFSCDDWVSWYFGEHEFGPEATAVAAITMTMVTGILEHQLKLLGRNFGVESDLINMISMKNEFYFITFNNSCTSKSYFASVDIVEGLVMGKKDIEVKGVHLIASTIDPKYKKLAHDMMQQINEDVANNKKIVLEDLLFNVASAEKEIIERIRKADTTMLKADKVKEASSYSLGNNATPINGHTLWKECFGEKYGYIDNPPYLVIRVPTTLKSKKKTNDWIDKIKDKQIAENLRKWLTKNKKENIGTFRIPKSILENQDLPIEIMDALDSKRIIFDNMNVSYIVLESIGYFMKEGMTLTEMGY